VAVVLERPLLSRIPSPPCSSIGASSRDRPLVPRHFSVRGREMSGSAGPLAGDESPLGEVVEGGPIAPAVAPVGSSSVWRLCRLRRSSSRSWSRGRAKDVIPARFGQRRRLSDAGPRGRICCSASSRSMHSAVPGAAAACGSCRRSRTLKWRAGSWSVSTCLRGLRRRGHPQMGHPQKDPGCTAPSRQPISRGRVGRRSGLRLRPIASRR